MIIILKSNYDKEFVFFIPSVLKKTNLNNTGKQIALYWINDDELVTCSQSHEPRIWSNDDNFIVIERGMVIWNDR